MTIKSEENDTMVSNTTKDCNICNDKFMKVAKMHFTLHPGKEEKDDNCFKCKPLYKTIHVEHFQEHCEDLYVKSSFPCNICQPKFNTMIKEHTIAVFFKNNKSHNIEDISACQ